jgi:hypothetical protein
MFATQRAVAVFACLFSLLAVGPACAMHTTFSASVDRFEADGNVFGPADGIPDDVDEFDDGMLAPDWSILLGTAVESGGVLTAKNPGADIQLIPGFLLDISNVEFEEHVLNGAGDFTVTSYWVSGLPALNTGFHFQLYEIGANGIEAAGLQVNHNDATTAHGDPVGYAISQEVTFVSGNGIPQHDAIAVDPSSVTGAIVLRMAFDDANDALTTSFSLDGGATFKSPFPPLHVFQVVDEHEILIGANSMQSTDGGPPPGCVSLLKPKLVVQRLTKPAGFQNINFQGGLPYAPGVPAGFNPVATGASVVLASFEGPVPTWSQNIPPGASGCNPMDGWRISRGTYVYRNVSNAVPPSCAAGSANGLREFRVKDKRLQRGEIDFTMKVKNTVVGRPSGVVTGAVAFGDGSYGCGSGPLICRHTSQAATCK